MIAIRYKLGNTGENLNALLKHIEDPHIDKVILFATEIKPDENYSREDTPETNLPGLVALAQTKIAGMHEIAIVFDGNFLTATRKPRYFEVRELLDRSLANAKVCFSLKRAPFTGSLSDKDAAKQLSENAGPLMPLTQATRSVYFQMLSSLSEKSYAEL